MYVQAVYWMRTTKWFIVKGWMKIVTRFSGLMFLVSDDPWSIKKSTMLVWSDSSVSSILRRIDFRWFAIIAVPTWLQAFASPRSLLGPIPGKPPNLWWSDVIEHLRNPSVFIHIAIVGYRQTRTRWTRIVQVNLECLSLTSSELLLTFKWIILANHWNDKRLSGAKIARQTSNRGWTRSDRTYDSVDFVISPNG